MKEKIRKLAKGIFPANTPDVVFDKTHLVFRVGEGEVYQGSFTLTDKNGGDIRGIVYPSSYRARVASPGFEANPVKIDFSFDSSGLSPGDVSKGRLTVVCDRGEYDLTYAAEIERPYVMTGGGRIQSLSDFKKLAENDFGEAARLFRSRQFFDVLKYEDVRAVNLYADMRRWSLGPEAMEEFLIGLKQKERIFLTLGASSASFNHAFDDFEDSFTVNKSTWGFVTAAVSASEDFISLPKKDFTTDDFVGNTLRVRYRVLSSRLHAGCNFCRIRVKTPYEEIHFDIKVRRPARTDGFKRKKNGIAARCVRAYLTYIAGGSTKKAWTDESLSLVGKLAALDPKDGAADLLQAHIFLESGRKDEAKWLLDGRRLHKGTSKEEIEFYAYGLYLDAKLKGDSSVRARAADEIERLYMKQPRSWPLLYMLVNLDGKYKDPEVKLRVLERQFFNGSNQTLLYAAAFMVFRENVHLLRRFGSFETQVLSFAVKYGLITENVALRAADLACRQNRYDPRLTGILKGIYEIYDNKTVLTALCMQLINGGLSGEKYYKWYENAVKAGLKIAQLYEFYVMSLPPEKARSPLPRIIYLYFSKGVTLDYKRTAVLYANILRYADQNRDIYETFRERIEAFAKSELQKRHIDDSLRYIYNRLFDEKTLTVEEKEALYDICHRYHVTTSAAGIRYVTVIEKDGAVRQRIAYTESGADIYLYDRESTVVFEGAGGRHYAESVPYDLVRMYYELRFIKVAAKRRTDSEIKNRDTDGEGLSLDSLRQKGFHTYPISDVFSLCSSSAAARGDEEDAFLISACLELAGRNLYDRNTLGYLARFFNGATRDMKFIWKKAKGCGIDTRGISERILTQMLFSGAVFGDEEIFEDYYAQKPYFRIKQAYLAYVSREYVERGRDMSARLAGIIVKEVSEKETLASVCEAAALKFYADMFGDKEADKKEDFALAGILQKMYYKLADSGMIFDFFLKYPYEWRTRVFLHDKYVAEYHGGADSKVSIIYRIGDEDTRTERLMPVFAGVYVKIFTVLAGEKLTCYFTEEKDGVTKKSSWRSYEPLKAKRGSDRYGMLFRLLSDEKSGGSDAAREAQAYLRDEKTADEIFLTFRAREGVR